MRQCASCGAGLPRMYPTRGALNEVSALFCSRCGTHVDGDDDAISSLEGLAYRRRTRTLRRGMFTAPVRTYGQPGNHFEQAATQFAASGLDDELGRTQALIENATDRGGSQR
jgi:hypothetical protein